MVTSLYLDIDPFDHSAGLGDKDTMGMVRVGYHGQDLGLDIKRIAILVFRLCRFSLGCCKRISIRSQNCG